MTPKFTPGPWAIGLETTDMQYQIITSGGWHLATVEHGPLMPNARAIAAVPDLISALLGAREALDYAIEKLKNPTINGHRILRQRRDEVCAALRASGVED